MTQRMSIGEVFNRAVGPHHATYHGVRANDARIICSCQIEARHRRSIVRRSLRVIGRISSSIRIYGSGIALALPLVLGATITEQRLTLVTAATRAAFVTPARQAARLGLGNVREEFFRTEVPYGALIYREAMRNDLPPELVAAVVKAESDFRPRLVSDKQALGLMQVLPETGQLMGATDLMAPSENLRAGTKYLKYLHGRFNGDLRLVLAAYNAGEGNIARFGGIPPFKETEDYLQKVVVTRRDYQRRLATRIAAHRLEETVRRASAR